MKKFYSFICVCFLLISYITNVFANESKNNKEPIQQFYIRYIESMLPFKIDENTTLVGASIKNEMLDFIHEIKDIPEEKFNDPQNKKVHHDLVVRLYCKDDPKNVMLKDSFPKGLNYIYYLKEKQVLQVHVDKSDCKAN